MSAARPSRRLPAARRRTQLLEVALQVFGTATYHGASMEDVADRAGVTKPVLYQHFPSKSELYRELIVGVGGELLGSIVEAARIEADPQRRLGAGFGAYFRFVGERTDAFGLLFGGARQEEEFAAAIEDVEASVAATIGGLIDADIAPEHRSLIGHAIVGLAEATGRQWVRSAGPRRAGAESATTPLDPDAGERIARRLTDLVWAGLRGLPGARAGSGPLTRPPLRSGS